MGVKWNCPMKNFGIIFGNFFSFGSSSEIFRSARTSYRTFDSRPPARPSARAKNPDHLYSLINHRRTTVNLSKEIRGKREKGKRRKREKEKRRKREKEKKGKKGKREKSEKVKNGKRERGKRRKREKGKKGKKVKKRKREKEKRRKRKKRKREKDK